MSSGKSQEVWSVTESMLDASASGVLCPIPAECGTVRDRAYGFGVGGSRFTVHGFKCRGEVPMTEKISNFLHECINITSKSRSA